MAAKQKLIRRQIMALLSMLVTGMIIWASQQTQIQPQVLSSQVEQQFFGDSTAVEALDKLEIKGRAPKTGYARAQFGDGWSRQGLCDTRNIILERDMTDTIVDDNCKVQSGKLSDPYTGESILFHRGENSNAVQIDHVVALSDAWQKGAQQLSFIERVILANDPLNLLAVDGPANQQKSGSDAASWLPPNKSFRCQYVARQIAVKQKYRLWVTTAEKSAMRGVLGACGRK